MRGADTLCFLEKKRGRWRGRVCVYVYLEKVTKPKHCEELSLDQLTFTACSLTSRRQCVDRSLTNLSWPRNMLVLTRAHPTVQSCLLRYQ